MAKKTPYKFVPNKYTVSQFALNQGFMSTKSTMSLDKNGVTKVTEEPMITRKGLLEIAREMHLKGELNEEGRNNLRATFKEGEQLPDFLKKEAI